LEARERWAAPAKACQRRIDSPHAAGARELRFAAADGHRAKTGGRIVVILPLYGTACCGAASRKASAGARILPHNARQGNSAAGMPAMMIGILRASAFDPGLRS
jgi:hypothetical protein